MSNYNNYDDIQDRHMDTMIRLAYLQKEALETVLSRVMRKNNSVTYEVG